MIINRVDNSSSGFFEALEDNQEAGRLTYQWNDSKTMTLVSTVANPELKGLGVGKKLVMAAVEFARANDIKFIVQCPFAKTVFERNPDIRDVLK